MAKTGPFRIDGNDYATDAAGNLTQTEPAKAEVVETIPKKRLVRMRGKRQTRLDEATDTRDRVNVRIAALTKEIADIDALIVGAR